MPAPRGNARTSILHLLKRGGSLTAQDVARELRVTAVAARKHLNALVADGYIVQGSRPGPRGRPAVVYSVSEAGESLFPKGYDQLLVGMLQDLAELEGEQKLEHLFRQRNERLAHTYQMRLTGKSLPEAVRELAQAREAEGYMASVEEDESRLILTEHNCPIIEVAQRFPQACHCEQQLFEQLLNTTVRRETTLAHGGRACRYHVGERPDDAT